MSAVAKSTIPMWQVKPEPDEPEFFGEEGLDMGPFQGPYAHSEHDLRCLWSLVWKRWREHRMCREIIRYNRMFSIEWWREAIEESWTNKPNLTTLKYVIAMAHSFQREGTPTERMVKKLAEANKAGVDCDIQTSEAVSRFWAEKSKPVTIDDVSEDDPVFLRMYNKIKGCQK
jgi:hypothetical protein